MSEDNKLIQCNFQKDFETGRVGCRLKIEIIDQRLGFRYCDEEKCRLVKIESTLNEIYRYLMEEYIKETP